MEGLGGCPATAELAHLYPHGLDAVGWLTGAAAVPPEAYLRSAPVSFPLIGLTQLATYAGALCGMGVGPSGGPGGPGRLLAALSGATGHSQGIVIAAAAGGATSWAELAAAGTQALALLLFSGARMQQAADALPPAPPAAAWRPAPRAPTASPADPSDEPSPMLSVSGLAHAELQAAIYAALAAIAKAERSAGGPPLTGTPAAPPLLTLSLRNGPGAAVVSGRTQHLRFLQAGLEAMRAPPGADQTRVPFSQRKPVVVSVAGGRGCKAPPGLRATASAQRPLHLRDLLCDSAVSSA